MTSGTCNWALLLFDVSWVLLALIVKRLVLRGREDDEEDSSEEPLSGYERKHSSLNNDG